MSSLINYEIEINSFNSVYYFEFGKNFSHAPEKHGCWEMVYADKGRIVAVTDGVDATLEQGQAIFHEPWEAHAHISDRETVNNMLVVTFFCNSPAMEFFRKKTFTLDKTARTLLSLFTDEAKKALGKIPGEYHTKTRPDFSNEIFGASQLMASHFSELLIKLIRSGNEEKCKISSDSEARTAKNNTLAELICGYFKDNLYLPLTLTDLYVRFHIGKSRLNSIFKECTGKSPKQYFNDLKTEEAKKLIREGNFSISEIADMLCYSGIQNFSRAFKNSTGFSPVEYKKSILL